MPIQTSYICVQSTAQHGKAPSYLQELIMLYKPNRALRSENSMLLHPPNDVRTKSYRERHFYKAAPTLWNSLPLSLQNVNSLDIFKRELKTHFLAHLTQRVMWGIAFTWRPSSIVRLLTFSYFNLLLWNNWAKWNQTWQKASI